MSTHMFHHVVSLRLDPIQTQGIEEYVRSLRWIDRHGEEHRIDLFAEFGEECLLLSAEKPAETRIEARDCSGLPDPDGRVDLMAEAAPPARFQVGDKVTPTSLENHCHFLKPGGVYTVEWCDHDMGIVGTPLSVCLSGMSRLWPASQFRLADLDPLADTVKIGGKDYSIADLEAIDSAERKYMAD